MPRPAATSEPPRALLLGMVYSKDVPPKRGQMFRDRVRCQALEQHGYLVSTLDDKHEESSAEDLKHCRSNFANANRMWRNIMSVWSSGGARGARTEQDKIATTYDTVILDYFFSPAGWVNTRWTEKFFSQTLPLLVERGLLKSTGSVWLPHLDHVDAMLQKFSDILEQHYTWTIEQNPAANPLYKATDDVSEELLRCPDNLTNDTQIMPLLELPGGPFYKLVPRAATKDGAISPVGSGTNLILKRKAGAGAGAGTFSSSHEPVISPVKKSKSRAVGRPKKT